MELGLMLAMAAVPVPERAMESGELVALLVTESVPVLVLGAVGEKVTLSDWLWLGFSVVVPVKPLTAKGALVCTVLRVTGVVPEFVSARGCGELVVPTGSNPKFSEVTLGVRVEEEGGVGGLVKLLVLLFADPVSPQPTKPASTTARSTTSKV